MPPTTLLLQASGVATARRQFDAPPRTWFSKSHRPAFGPKKEKHMNARDNSANVLQAAPERRQLRRYHDLLTPVDTQAIRLYRDDGWVTMAGMIVAIFAGITLLIAGVTPL